MATELEIKRVLDLVTSAPVAQIESLSRSAQGHTESLRRVINSTNIVAVGISEKVSNNEPTGKLALTHYVEKKMPLAELSADMAIPPTVPDDLTGNVAVPIDVVEIGKIRPELNVARGVIQPGNSIGHIDVTAGTLGAVVTDGKNKFLLSNSHVLANSGLGKKGDVIVYPGIFDGGVNPADLVAELHDFMEFKVGGDFINRADCAIVKPIDGRLNDITAEILGLGIPKGTIRPVRGMKLVKVGRTTGMTEGEVKDVHFRFVLDYDGVGSVGFIDQVFCTRYSDGGDSGSLVLDKASGKAMGLHFAGANGGSIFNPIQEVLTALNVKLVTAKLVASEAAKAKQPAAPKTKASLANAQ